MLILLRKFVAGFKPSNQRIRRLFLASAGLGALFFLLALAKRHEAYVSHPAATPAPRGEATSLRGNEIASKWDGPDDKTHMVPSLAQSEAASPLGNQTDAVATEARLVYSAELGVNTKEFARSRSSLEKILELHGGYVAKLRLSGQPGGSQLSATLRIPSSEYRSALSELKSIGSLEHEEESADEVTQQHSELEARLLNARNSANRLQSVLENLNTKYNDPGPVERQLAQLRLEIKRMEAERVAWLSRTIFASVFLTLQEVVTVPVEPLGAQLRGAAATGVSDAVHTFLWIFILLVGYGPSLLLWLALLYFPARFIWRRSRQMVLGPAA